MNDKIQENGQEILELYKEAYDVLTGQNFSTSMDIAFWKYRDRIAKLSDYKVGIVNEMNNSNIARGTYSIYLMAEPDILEFLSQYIDEDMKDEKWVRDWYKGGI